MFYFTQQVYIFKSIFLTSEKEYHKEKLLSGFMLLQSETQKIKVTLI